MTTINRPIRHPGTPAVREANRRTHRWFNDDDEIRCYDCDIKFWHTAAEYPCGETPPRETVEIEGPTMADLHPGLT